MTVQATNAVSGPFTGNGATTSFPFTFEAVASSEVTVLIGGTAISSSLYTVTLNPSGNGGTVIMLTAPASGAEVKLESNPSFAQQISFTNSGPFLAEVIEEALDRAALRDISINSRLVVAEARIAALESGTGYVPPPAPTATIAPTIAGATSIGATLTATPGTYTGSPTITKAWLRNGTAISGATGGTYVLINADIGTSITHRETATNVGGTITSTSNAIGPVTGPITSDTPSIFMDTDEAVLTAQGFYRTAPFARVAYTTTATSIDVTAWGNNHASLVWRDIGLLVNDVYQRIELPLEGNNTVTIGLAAGTKRLDFVNGLQRTPNGEVFEFGSFFKSISANAFITPVTDAVTDRIVFHGDSITNGADSFPTTQKGYALLLRDRLSRSVGINGAGGRSFRHDAVDATARAAFVAEMVAWNPATLWLAIGTNDYTAAAWTAADFGTAYAATLDALNAALPSMEIYCQTLLLRGAEGVDNALGDNPADFRAAISAAVSTRTSYATLVNGLSILTDPADFTDGLHPNDGGHAKYADFVEGLLLNLPINTALPVITTDGTPAVGETISVSSGTWANSPTSFTYQWRRGGVAISGQTASTYVVVSADVGTNLDCVVTAINAGGSRPATATAIPIISTAPFVASDANSTAVDQGGGVYRATKVSGGTGFNTSVYGTVAFAGDFTLKIVPGQQFFDAIVGVNNAPTTGVGIADIDFSFYLTGLDEARIWENGADTGAAGVYTTGNPVFIGRRSGSITYRTGAATFDAATVHRTVANAATLYADSSLFTVGAFIDLSAV